jgi:hypothetical protein
MTWTQVADLVAVVASGWLVFGVGAAVWVCHYNRRDR